MKTWEIKRQITNDILYNAEGDSLKEVLEKAVRDCANLYGANLRGANLLGADLRGANLRGANLRGANLLGADLGGANLLGADLGGANLRGANLYGADLRCANLRCANLRGANLYGAKNISKYVTTPLYILKDQPGKIVAYKLVNQKSEGHINGGLKYEIGEEVSVKDANEDENQDCGKGINLATLDWCLKDYKEGYRILLCEFEAKDIAAIPIGSDGKFRVHRCKVIGEKDLKELGD